MRGRDEIDALRSEVRDRYGPLPAEVEGLLAFAGLRIRAEALGILQADLGPSAVHLKLGPETPLGGPGLAKVVAALPGASLSPQGVLRAPVAAAPRPLRALDEILAALEALAPADAAERAGSG
jgi:transcription-repair coupling factor (superfamily II helicase)